MATYDYGIRKGLVDKGVANSDIGFNPATNSVTVKGKDFLKSGKSYQGTNFSDKNTFNQAWDTYAKAQQQPAQTGKQPQSTTGGYLQATGYNKPNTYGGIGTANQMISGISSQVQPQQVQQYNQPSQTQPDITKMLYDLWNQNQNQPAFDAYGSPAYAAAQAQADRAAKASTRQAQEAFGSAGFGRSTALGERVAGINNDQTEYLMTQVLPQIQEQEAARKQRELQNFLSIISPMQEQQRFAEDRAQSRAGITGSLITPEAEQIMNVLNNLKTDTEKNWMTMTPEQRIAANAEGNQLRAMLEGMQVDPNLFGAGVTANQARANVGKAGQRTLESEELEQRTANDLRNYERDVLEYDREFEYTAGRDKAADAQWQAEFDYKVQQDGLSAALDWAKQNLNEQKERRVAAGKTSSSGSKSSGGSSNVKPSTEKTIQDINMPRTAATMETYIISKLPGGKEIFGPPSPHQTELIEDMILDNPNLSEADMVKLYKKFGIPLPT